MVDITKIDTFVQNSPHPTWLATSRGECLYANPALERLTGLKSDQINQVDWRSFVLDEDRAAATASWQRSIATETPYCTRVRMRGYDGVPATVELIAFGHKVGEGTEVWLFSGLPVDGPTQEPTSLEAYLQATLNVIPAYIWYALPSGGLTFVNKRTADYLGLPKDHPLCFGIDMGAEWDSHIPLLHPDDREEARNVWSTCLGTGCAFELRFRVRDGEGGYRWFLSRAEPLRASDGTLLYWIGVNLEIDDAERAEQELRNVIDTIPAIVWSALPDGSNTYVNSRLVEYMGMKAEQMTGSGWENAAHPDDLQQHLGKWRASVASGEPHENELRFRRADGEYRWHLNRGVPLRDKDGNIIKWYGVVTDIEDRKRAEQTLQLMSRDLQESKAKLEEAQRITHVGYWEWDVLTGRINWSDETYRIFGLEPQERPMDLDAVRKKTHPDDWQRGMEQALRGGAHLNAECRVFRPTGEVRIAHFQGDVKRDASDRPYHLFGTVQDITDRKRAEEKLYQSQFYFAEGQRLAHMGSWAFNTNGFNYWSSELFQIHGLDPRGEPPTIEEYLALVHREDREFLAQGIQKMLVDRRAFDFTKRIVRPDGEIRRIRCVGAPVTLGETFQGFLGTGMDVTEQERLMEELRLSEHYLSEGERLAHMGSWVFNPSGVFDHWSHELFQIYGLDPAKGAPSLENYLACVHQQDRKFMASLIQRMLADASGCDVTKRILRPNGELRYIRCVGTPVVENGTLQRIVGTAIDVTDHELLTQELRRREAYLAEAQRLSHTGSFGWKPDSGEIVWSKETYRIFEYPGAVTPTMDLIEQRVHPEDRAAFQEVINQASVTGTDFVHTYRLLLPDGRVKHFHVQAHATHDGSGNLEFLGAGTDITERKNAEDKIRRLVDANILGVFIADVESACVVGANEAILRMLQYSHEELVSRRMRWADLTPPEWHERDERAVVSAKTTGAFQPYEKEFFRKDGSRIPVLVGGAQFEDGKESVGFFLDLSEQKRAEEALRQSENYLAEAQRITHTGSWVWQVAGRDALHLSDEWYRIYGFDPKQGMPNWGERLQRVHPDDRSTWQGTIERAIRERSDYEVEFRILLPDGTLKWVHTVDHRVLTAAGELDRFVGSSTDITERKNAEEKVREREAELRQMLDLTPQLVSVFGARRERLCANRILLDYLGLSNEEWLQCSDRNEDIHPDDRELVNDVFEWASPIGSAFEVEMRLRKDDGSYRWFLARYNPLRDDKGHITRWYVAGTDIDERKRAEDRLRLENTALREEIDQTSMFEEIIGTSPALQTVLSRISKVAPSDSTVLITGETGTGKELVARAIHRRSRRSGRAFVSVNCAAIPRDLIASELFGHEKGAFTGAMQRRLGRFEMADGGTIFLDEVGELSPETQVALLRVLQEREFERVGGGQAIHVDVRIIAATNRDLKTAVANGTFRQDLFYRLNVFPIEVPPLRERKDDILMLVEYYVQRYATRAGKTIRSIEKKTLDVLQSYDWPGNIRELQNIIERSVILGSGDVVSVDEMWLSKQTSRPASRVEASAAFKGEAESRSERAIIEAALADSRGKVSGPSGAAARLGIPPSTLDHRIKALRIDKRQFKFRYGANSALDGLRP